jgi:hypothetical protein
LIQGLVVASNRMLIGLGVCQVIEIV